MQATHQVDPADKTFILEKIDSFDKLEGQKQETGSIPLISGPFNNWTPKPMTDIREFCHCIDIEKKDVFEICKNHGRIHSSAKTIEDLTEDEQKAYKKEFKIYFDSYLRNWKPVILPSLQYRKPNLVNAHLIEDDLEVSPLYVYVCFMKTGRNYYSVEIPRANKEPRRFVHRCLAKCRVEEIPKYSSENKLTFVERQFKKETSVFAPWVEDTPKSLEKCCDWDFKYWRVPTMVKNEEDRA